MAASGVSSNRFGQQIYMKWYIWEAGFQIYADIWIRKRQIFMFYAG